SKPPALLGRGGVPMTRYGLDASSARLVIMQTSAPQREEPGARASTSAPDARAARGPCAHVSFASGPGCDGPSPGSLHRDLHRVLPRTERCRGRPAASLPVAPPDALAVPIVDADGQCDAVAHELEASDEVVRVEVARPDADERHAERGLELELALVCADDQEHLVAVLLLSVRHGAPALTDVALAADADRQPHADDARGRQDGASHVTPPSLSMTESQMAARCSGLKATSSSIVSQTIRTPTACSSMARPMSVSCKARRRRHTGHLGEQGSCIIDEPPPSPQPSGAPCAPRPRG